MWGGWGDFLQCMHNQYFGHIFLPSTFYQIQTTSILIITIKLNYINLCAVIADGGRV